MAKKKSRWRRSGALFILQFSETRIAEGANESRPSKASSSESDPELVITPKFALQMNRTRPIERLRQTKFLLMWKRLCCGHASLCLDSRDVCGFVYLVPVAPVNLLRNDLTLADPELTPR
jgi:hypothetical protein